MGQEEVLQEGNQDYEALLQELKTAVQALHSSACMLNATQPDNQYINSIQSLPDFNKRLETIKAKDLRIFDTSLEAAHLSFT